MEVHRALGPGLLEHTYQVALMRELELDGIKAESEVNIPFFTKGKSLIRHIGLILWWKMKLFLN